MSQPTIIPPPVGTPIGWSPNSLGLGAPAIIQIVTNDLVAQGGGALPARLRRYEWYANDLAGIGIGFGPNVLGANNAFISSEADSNYLQLGDAGGANSTAYVTTPLLFQFRRWPIHWECQVRSSALNQTNYRMWCGLQTSTVAILSNTLGLGVAFRYVHPAPNGPDSGSWIIAVNDGTTQVETTTIPVIGGPGAQNTYRMTIDVNGTTISWAIFNLTNGDQLAGSTPIPALFNLATGLSGAVTMEDIPGGVKRFLIAKLIGSCR